MELRLLLDNTACYVKYQMGLAGVQSKPHIFLTTYFLQSRLSALTEQKLRALQHRCISIKLQPFSFIWRQSLSDSNSNFEKMLCFLLAPSLPHALLTWTLNKHLGKWQWGLVHLAKKCQRWVSVKHFCKGCRAGWAFSSFQGCWDSPSLRSSRCLLCKAGLWVCFVSELYP